MNKYGAILPIQALAGFLLLLFSGLFLQPEIKGEIWAMGLLLAVPFVWKPMIQYIFESEDSLQPYRFPRFLHFLYFPAGICLWVALAVPPGLIAVLWSLPWVGISLFSGIYATYLFFRNPVFTLFHLNMLIPLGFFSVGGVWVLSHCAGYQPMGFSPAIVLLTGLHFHYAGLIFPLLIGLLLLYFPSFLSKVASVLALSSIPLTALGITTTQLFHIQLFETISGAGVAVSGWLCAYLYIKNLFRADVPVVTRLFWGIAGFSLLFSMSLASLYALRTFFPMDMLTIPNMRALHGTVNALGVAGGGVLGWAYLVWDKKKRL